MKTAKQCLPCYLRQALRVARLNGCDESVQREIQLKISSLLPALDYDLSPPENAIKVYAAIAEITGCADPYREIKQKENAKALAALPSFRKRVQSCGPEGLAEAVRIAIAGNIIDYGVSDRFDLDETFARLRDVPLALDDLPGFLKSVNRLQKGGQVLYLADNSGEIVYDSLVIELLAELGLNVTVAVKGAPIINDALMEDAMDAGLDRVARIVSNGTGCPGTPLALCTTELRELFWSADIVISKGQGNFETLSETQRDVFFFLTVKCEMVGKHLAEVSGTSVPLTGNGEMVVYHSRKV